MKIAVMGAGAVGCYFGGMLARAGHDVVLIGRPGHVVAIRENGLEMETKTFHERVRLSACEHAEGVADAQLVLFCVKSPDTESTAEAIRPFLAHDAFVLSLQNGIDNAARLQAILGDRVDPAVVYVASEMAGPGRLKHHGRGDLVLPPRSAERRFDRLFSDAGIPVVIADNIALAQWSKLAFNCACNALSAISHLPYGRFIDVQGARKTMIDIVQECRLVAAAEGVVLPDGLAEGILSTMETIPGQYSSTAQDLARGKPSEIDHINGYVVRRGEALGLAVPLNRLLHLLVRLAEFG